MNSTPAGDAAEEEDVEEPAECHHLDETHPEDYEELEV
jgi:hypothetical protein